LNDTILARTARGAGWVMAWRFGMRILGLVSTLVLVRLLAPADFGLIALASGFMQSVDGLMSLGTEEAVIRARDPDRTVYDTGFTLTAMRGLFVAVLVAIAAFPAAHLFGDPRLGPVLLVVAVLPLLDGLSNIGTVDFRRNMTFHKEFALMVLPKFGGILAAILAAVVWHSYVAMLCGMLVNRTLRMVMTYVMHPFRPRFSLRARRALVGYSFWSWLLSLAALLRDRSDSLILGRLVGPTPLGFYSVGAEIAALPMTEFIEPLGRASFAGFAAARQEGTDVRAMFLRLLGFSALLAFPVGLGLSAVAAPLTHLALGPGWDAAVPVLRVLSVTATMLVVGHLSQHFLSAQALLRPLVAITLCGAGLRIVLLFALIPPFGATGAALAVGLAVCAEQAVILMAALRRLDIAAATLAGQFWRPAAAASFMAAGLVLLGIGWAPATGIGPLAGTIAAGAALFVLPLLALWLATGRPPGAESDLLALGVRSLKRARVSRRR
jgi:O-antigen/teichoic acid export membrane protein